MHDFTYEVWKKQTTDYYYEVKPNLFILIKMQTGFLELSLLLIFVDCKSITEPFLYQKGANNCS